MKLDAHPSGRHFLQIPGPSPVPDRILRAMSLPTIDHRGPEFGQLGRKVLGDMQAIFQTRHPVIIYPASGTGAWEAALANVLSPGDHVLMYETGHFAFLWTKLAKRLGLETEVLTLPGIEGWRRGVQAELIEQRLQALGITLPPVAVPAASYLPFARTGNLVFLSGHIAKKDGQVWVGQLGKTMVTAEGQQAARAIAIDLMGTLAVAAGGLDKVQRIVKVMSLVNSTPAYTEQHLVTNGCSELIAQVFGAEIGSHARSAFGVAQLPLGACVEIELIAEVA